MGRGDSGAVVLAIDAQAARRGHQLPPAPQMARNSIRLRRYEPAISLSRAKKACFLALEILQSIGND
jgi:hypothetical protein